MKRCMVVLGVCLALLAAGCADSESADSPGTSSTTAPSSTTTASPTTTTAPPSTSAPADRPACVGADWVQISPGPFIVLAPPDLVDQQAQGIDSLYGRYVGGGLDLAFDFGRYSQTLDGIERLGATISPVALGAIEAEFGSVDATGEGYEHDFLTQLYASSPADPGNALWLGIGYDDAALTATAECVVSTTRFV